MKDLTVGKEGRLILNFAIPMLLGNIFQQMYQIIDSIVVGNHIGKEALAAVGASFPIIFILISLIIGIASGSTVIIAQYYGAKDMNRVRRSIDTMFIFLFFASIIATILGISLSKYIFLLLGLPREILPQAMTYLNVFMLGTIPSFGYNGVSAVLRGLGDSKTPLYFLLISTIMNIILVILFVMVFEWGIAGAAAATVIAQTGAFVTAALYLNRTHKVVHVSFTHLTFDRELFRQSIRIGLPTGVQQTFVSLGMAALLGIVNKFGTNVIAAYSLAGRIDSFAGVPAMIFSQALSTFAGQNLGAKKPERVKKGFVSTLMMSGIYSIAVTILVVFFGRYITGLFTKDYEVIRIGTEYLVIISSFYILFSTMLTINGLLRGAGDTMIPMFISLFSLWIIRIPIAWLLSGKIGETGIWWSIPIGWAFGTLVYYLYYLTGRWKSKVVVVYR
jgi:putative MATE family efflux protein